MLYPFTSILPIPYRLVLSWHLARHAGMLLLLLNGRVARAARHVISLRNATGTAKATDGLYVTNCDSCFCMKQLLYLSSCTRGTILNCM